MWSRTCVCACAVVILAGGCRVDDKSFSGLDATNLDATLVDATLLDDAASEDASTIDGAGPDAMQLDAAPVGVWRPTASLPSSRFDLGVATSGDVVYAVGGSRPGGEVLDQVLFAHVEPSGDLGAWTATSALPSRRSGLIAVVHGGYLYALGGGNGAAPTSDVWFAPIQPDGSVGAWVPTASFAAPRISFAAVVVGDRVYALGGNGIGQNYTDVLVATFAANGSLGGWAALTPLPAPLTVHAAFATATHLYVVGGTRTGEAPNNLVTVAPINPDGTIGAWSATTPFTTGRGWHASLLIGGTVYLLGGTGPGGSTYFGDAQVATVTASGAVGPWMPTMPLPGPRGASGAVAVGGRLYLVGGRDATTVFDAVHVMTPGP